MATQSIQLKNAKKLDLNDYEVYQTLGCGAFGRVKLSKNKQTGNYVALKRLKKGELIRLKQVDHIINENRILANMNHPYIVKMEGFCQDSKYLS